MTISIFIDLFKALYIMDRTFLLKKLNYYGTNDKADGLFESYLTNRKRFALYEDTRSDMTV